MRHLAYDSTGGQFLHTAPLIFMQWSHCFARRVFYPGTANCLWDYKLSLSYQRWVSQGDRGRSWTHILLAWTLFSDSLMSWQEGFGCGWSRGDSHTFDLIKLFTYPHMPPGPFAGHMKDGAWAKTRGGERGALLGPGIQREKVQWHAGRKSASDQQGLANQSVRREASCSFWPQRKEPRSRWCSPVPAVLQRRGRKGKGRRRRWR